MESLLYLALGTAFSFGVAWLLGSIPGWFGYDEEYFTKKWSEYHTEEPVEDLEGPPPGY